MSRPKRVRLLVLAVLFVVGCVCARHAPACMLCHGEIGEATANMPLGYELPCTFCHGGSDTAATTKEEEAHVPPMSPVINDNTTQGLDDDLLYQKFVNPSNLRVVGQTCYPCHWNQVEKIFKSIMATTAGHTAGGLYQNGVVDTKTPI